MSLELYNATKNTKVVPKYNYDGKIKLGPGETCGIEEYMTKFYKPWASIGIVVRVVPDSNSVVAESGVLEDSTVTEVEETTKTEETVSENHEVETVEEVKKYTKGELESMSFSDIKSLVTELGVEVTGKKNQKSSYVNSILDSYK